MIKCINNIINLLGVKDEAPDIVKSRLVTAAVESYALTLINLLLFIYLYSTFKIFQSDGSEREYGIEYAFSAMYNTHAHYFTCCVLFVTLFIWRSCTPETKLSIFFNKISSILYGMTFSLSTIYFLAYCFGKFDASVGVWEFIIFFLMLFASPFVYGWLGCENEKERTDFFKNILTAFGILFCVLSFPMCLLVTFTLLILKMYCR